MAALISNAEARRLFLHRQGLCFTPREKLTDAGLLALIEHLGFVQVDSINTVERAHHLILFSRNQTYRRPQLARLIEREAALFENWTHDASVIPTGFYPYWQPRFARERVRLRDRWRKWRRGDFEDFLDDVRRHIDDHGPAMARDFDNGGTRKGSSGWWDWHPAKTALEYLWRTGELAVARRDGFQKVYDLAERVIPEPHRRAEPSEREAIDWACRAALHRLGAATPGEIAGFWGAVSPAEAKAWCRDRLEDELAEVAIEAADGSKPRAAYATADLMQQLADLPPPAGRLRILSPFDPLLRDRARARRLFDFDYRIEVFVPEAKRQYGYYVFPILEGDRFVGRIDMKHLRQDGVLAVKGLWLEPRQKMTRGRERGLNAELDRLRRFVDADRIRFENGYLRPTT